MRRSFSFKDVLCKFKIKLKNGSTVPLEIFPGENPETVLKNFFETNKITKIKTQEKIKEKIMPYIKQKKQTKVLKGRMLTLDSSKIGKSLQKNSRKLKMSFDKEEVTETPNFFKSQIFNTFQSKKLKLNKSLVLKKDLKKPLRKAETDKPNYFMDKKIIDFSKTRLRQGKSRNLNRQSNESSIRKKRLQTNYSLEYEESMKESVQTLKKFENSTPKMVPFTDQELVYVFYKLDEKELGYLNSENLNLEELTGKEMKLIKPIIHILMKDQAINKITLNEFKGIIYLSSQIIQRLTIQYMKPRPFDNTSSLNNTIKLTDINISTDLDSRIIKTQDSISSKVHKPQIYVSNLPNKIQNWINSSLFKINDSNCLDQLDQLLRDSKKYKKTLKECIEKKEKFNDKSFSKNSQSLQGFYTQDNNVIEKTNIIGWASFEHFFNPPYVIFDEIRFDDIIQGSLGDCYFLAAISSLAQNPHRLKRLFLIKEYNPYGLYVVALCLNGIWQEILLDEFFPCYVHRKQPSFNYTQSQQLWVMLLEKAYAKAHGGYYNINRGLSREALRDLTGASCRSIFIEDFSNHDDLWKILTMSVREKFILTCGSNDLSNGTDSYNEQIGLAGNHAYSLLDIKEVIYYEGKYTVLPKFTNVQVMNFKNQKINVERLLKLRNPWGKLEWKGKWSDQDKRWNNQLRSDLEYKFGNDGIFYITLQDFTKYFHDVQICEYYDDFKYSSLKLHSENEGEIFLKFQINKQERAYLSVNQINRRYYDESQKYEYSCLKMFVFRQDEMTKKLEYVGASMNEDKENWISLTSQGGQYYVYIKTRWKSQVRDFSFSVYSSQKVVLEKLEKHDFPINFLNRVLFRKAKNSNQELNHIGNNLFTKKQDLGKNGGYGYIYLENQNKDKEVFFNLSLQVSQNMKGVWPFQSQILSLNLKPLQRDIIVYEAISEEYMAQMKSSFIVKGYDERIKDQIKQSGQMITQKKYKEKQVKIFEYGLNTPRNIFMMYENKSEYFVLSIQFEFLFENCYLVNNNKQKEFEMVCRPGEVQILEIRSQQTPFECFVVKKVEKIMCMLDEFQ